jgi:3-oxoacyl-[acyl-carrier protein] reductase
MSEQKMSILVTGASSGIGRAIAVHLAKDGYDIAVHYGRNRQGAELTMSQVERYSANSRLVSFDVSDAQASRQAIEADMGSYGAYYGVVCNAGITRDGVFPALSAADWKQVIDVNLNGFYNVLHPVVLPMVKRRKPGRIVTISSVSGLMGNHGQVNYSASKAGIIGASKALALDLARKKITVNCVAPGLIASEMTDDLPLEQILGAIPAGRIGQPEEVAACVSFLCSPEAAYITRQVLAVNGGLC